MLFEIPPLFIIFSLIHYISLLPLLFWKIRNSIHSLNFRKSDVEVSKFKRGILIYLYSQNRRSPCLFRLIHLQFQYEWVNHPWRLIGIGADPEQQCNRYF